MNLTERAGDIHDYVSANFFTDNVRPLLQGLSGSDGYVLVETEAEGAAYPFDKVIVHTDRIALKGKPIILDTKYASRLIHDLAANLVAATSKLKPLSEELSRARSEAASKAAMLAALERGLEELTVQRDNALRELQATKDE